jgi:hypothetical protein
MFVSVTVERGSRGVTGNSRQHVNFTEWFRESHENGRVGFTAELRWD